MIQERYKLHPSLDTVLLFNEDAIRPVASVSMSDIPTQTLNNVIASNQYLALPRLSSQDLLEGLFLTNDLRSKIIATISRNMSG